MKKGNFTDEQIVADKLGAIQLVSLWRSTVTNGMDSSSPYHFGVDAPEW
jgi:hypothetical protein